MATTTATQIQQLYVGLLGRAADQGGLNWWADQVTTGGKTLEDVRASFVTSTEYTTTYGAAATRADLVTSIYQNLFERTPSADEVKYWAETDTRPADQLVAAFIEFAGAADQAVINNKTFVAQTYTDTAGTSYNGAAGAAVIVGVNGTVASVNTAIASIANGTLAGLIPGVSLVNALTSAQTAEAAVQTANTAAVNALVTKLAANVAVGTQTDLLAVDAAYSLKVAAIAADATTFRGATYVSADSTAVLTTKASDAASTLTTARAGVTTTADKALVANYDSAVVTEASALAAKPTAIVKGNVVGGLQADASAAAGLATLGTPAAPPAAAIPKTAAEVYTAYVNGSVTQRQAIDTALKDSSYYATFKATVAKDASYLDAVKAKLAAQDILDTDTTESTQVVDGVTITNTDNVTGGTAATNTYVAASIAKVAADVLVAKAIAADADVAAVKVITDANTAANNLSLKAAADIQAFNDANTTVQIKTVATANAESTVKESFYFAAKPTGAVDYTVGTATASTQFGAGDSIILGTGYTYNSGALSTGNNNALEFFLVKTDTGTQIVVEGSVFGSASVTANATTGVATAADAVSVINLVGVTTDHLSVANGVISYV